MRLKKTRISAIAISAVLALSACGGDGDDGGGSGGTAGADTIKIGFMGDLTGENAGIVKPPRNGAQLAVEEYNQRGKGPKVEIVEYDTQGQETQATALVQQAIQQDKITALIGPAFSGESKAVGQILEQAKLVSVSPSATNPALAQNSWKYWHRVVANDGVQGPAAADFLIKAKAPKKAFVINDKQEYSVGLGDAVFKQFQSKGLDAQRDAIDQRASDYSSTVTKVRSFNPDVIYFGGYYAQGGRLIKQLRDGGVNALFATGDGSLDQQLISGAGQQQAEGALVTCPCLIPFGSTEAGLKKFEDAYKAKFSADPAIYSTEGYDAANAILKALEAGNTTSDKINTFLSTLDFQGVSKQIKFNPNGEVSASAIHVYEVKGGKIGWLGDTSEAQLSG